LKTGASGSKLSELTSRFYTIIPHDFGRKVPSVIRDPETLQKKFDMLLVSACAVVNAVCVCEGVRGVRE
jgi:poly [ADP-ribose] polymerase